MFMNNTMNNQYRIKTLLLNPTLDLNDLGIAHLGAPLLK
jgi:hypothetical protein